MDIILTLPICSAGFSDGSSQMEMAPSDCAELFKKYDILGFIADYAMTFFI